MTTSRPRRVVVAGYASVDRTITISAPLRPGSTATIVGGSGGRAHSDASTTTARKPGGIGYTTTALASRGIETSAIAWVGDDEAGHDYIARLQQAGAVVDGIEVNGPTSPSALMVYDPDGVCTCLFDPGSGAPSRLTSRQRDILAESTHVVMMVAPEGITAEVLDLIEDRPLTFVMKADEQSQPGGMTAAAVQRADTVFCNHLERALIDPFVRPDQIVVTTAGGGPVRVEQYGASTLIKNPDPLRGPIDLTGAGDTLVGSCLACMLNGTSIEESVRAGAQAATDLLRSRAVDHS